MSLQSKEFTDVFSNSNKLPENTKEGITSNDVRSELRYADRTVKDDAEDYVFLRPHRHSGKKRRKHHRKKMKTYKKIILAVLITLLSIVVILVGTFAFLVYNGSQQLLKNESIITAPEIENVTLQNNGETVIYNGKEYQYNKNITSILCMGVDKEQLADTQSELIGQSGQADVIILMAMDTLTGKTTLLNVSRDTMTDIAVYSHSGSYVETINAQLCLAYAYGDGKETSCENTVTAVQRLFYNIPINSYFALDLDGIAALNDCVGGIDVVSPETIGNFVEGESYHLEGDTAESFVRSRSHETADGNSNRMQRQQVYLNSFMDKIISQSKEDIMTPVNLFNESAAYSCTNLNPSKVCYLAENILLNGGMSIEMKTVPGEVKQGEVYAEYYINEDEFYEMFLETFYTPV